MHQSGSAAKPWGDNFDAAFVCIGTNFQSSLEITSQLKEMGAKRVVSKATGDIQAKFLLRNGADEVIYPEKDLAEKLAAKFHISILGIRRGEDASTIMPSADYVIRAEEHLIVLSENKNLEQLMKRIR